MPDLFSSGQPVSNQQGNPQEYDSRHFWLLV